MCFTTNFLWGQPLPSYTPFKLEEFADFTAPYCNPNSTAKQQLSIFPLPRYAVKHSLMPNYPSFIPNTAKDFLQQPNPSNYTLITPQTYAEISLEFAKKWNYYFPVSTNLKEGLSPYYHLLNIGLCDTANKYPDIPRCAMGLWKQIQPDIVNQTGPNAATLQQFPNAAGIVPANANSGIPNTCLTSSQAISYLSDAPDREANPANPTMYYLPNCLTNTCATNLIQNNWLADEYYYTGEGVDTLYYGDIAIPHKYKNGFWQFFGNYDDYLLVQSHFSKDCLEKMISPIAPTISYEMTDGTLYDYYVKIILDKLNYRSSLGLTKIDYICENAEVESKNQVLPDLHRSIQNNRMRKVLINSPDLHAAYWATNPNDIHFLDDQAMYNFVSSGIANRLSAYWQQTRLRITELERTIFAVYGADGERHYRPEWDVYRNALTDIRKQKYSTPDFYPYMRWWSKAPSAYNGWDWIVRARNEEIPLPTTPAQQQIRNTSDKLFSPWVSAGWSPDENFNKRPAQYLGLLKALNMAGAEFFHVGFFGDDGYQYRDLDAFTRFDAVTSVNKINQFDFKLPNFIWQPAIASYAQATASRYENILLNGDLMEGTPNISTGTINNNHYRFIPTNIDCGLTMQSTDALVVARKENSRNKFALTATLQPLETDNTTNYVPSADADETACVTIDFPIAPGNDIKLTFGARRQGSTYIYDRIDPNNILFYQLDGWHEWKHPLHWDKDFLIEAELYDATDQPANCLHTEGQIIGANREDYTQAYTYIKAPKPLFDAKNTFYYNFQPRTTHTAPFNVFLVLRDQVGVSAPVEVLVSDDTNHAIFNGVAAIGCPSTQWFVYKVSGNFYASQADATHTIKIDLPMHVEIDKMYITKNHTAPSWLGNVCIP
jgi:hypothetical protein